MPTVGSGVPTNKGEKVRRLCDKENSLFEKNSESNPDSTTVPDYATAPVVLKILLAARSISHATGQHEIDCAFAGNVRKKTHGRGKGGGGG